jgi:hypothetical protein
MFSFAKKSLWQLPPGSRPSIPQQELVDEEVCPAYDSAAFYPARPGEVLTKKFQLLVKIGWGSQSTVWLARDISRYLPTSVTALACFILATEKLTLGVPIKTQMASRTNSGPENKQQQQCRWCSA